MVKDELLIPNDISIWNASQYELTGYINDVNTEYTQVLMEFGSNGRWSNVYDYGVQRNSVNIKNGEKAYYLYDGRGSVANLTSQRGASMVYYEYNIYGEADASRAGVHNPYRYNAEYTDAATGLQYLRARYYDPETSRFMTKDTYLGEINDPLSRHLYTYTRNNPINLIDPSGHLFGLLIGAVIVAAAAYGSYRAVKNYNEQSAQIRSQQANYESQATVQENVTTRPQNLRAPTSADQVGSFSYYNERDNKVVTFTTAAAYYEYKKLCEDLDKLLASNIVHNTLDAVGVIPGVGEVADAINGTIYLAEGDYTNAALSYVSCIPLGGDAVGKGGKLVNSAIDASDDILDLASDTLRQTDNIADTASDVIRNTDNVGWHVGDPIDNLTKAGNEPAWSTVRQRYWKNEAYYNAGNYDADNLERMKKGLAPQSVNPNTGELESMELHHIIPQRDSGPNTTDNLMPLWPDEHALVDPYRNTGR